MIDEYEWQEQIIAEEREFASSATPVRNRVKYVNFLSKSKGRNRRRKRPVEVDLVTFGNETHSWDKCPFDCWAGQIYGYDDDLTETRLMREIPLYAARR